MKVGVLGTSYRIADLSLRDRVIKGAQSLFRGKNAQFYLPNVFLSTCNRVEIYFSGEDLAEIQSEILAMLQREVSGISHKFYSYFGKECFAHLCRVTSGLDSAIFAETEIQRQVKEAYYSSTQDYKLTCCLHFLFQKSLKISKLVRNATPLQSGAVDLKKVIFQLMGEQREKSILFVGNSEINRCLSQYFYDKGWKNLEFCTKYPEKNSLFPMRNRGILQRWESYEVIICGTNAKEYLIQKPQRFLKKKILIFDLSVPRVVNPEVEMVSNCDLWNIDQLDQIIAERRQCQMQERELLETILHENTHRLFHLYQKKRRYCCKSGAGLKICMPRIAGKGDDVSNILHASDELYESFKTDAIS